ncbi:sugar transferase, partial [Loktanella salsilacus]|uniref:sugar transferase n=1 Tax=Loktanella salsilacus TaxID=195913 RepID=UPI0030039FFF
GKPFQIYNDLGKRVLDVSVVLLSLPFVLIVVGLLAVFVARRGGKPFYTQNRVGRGGRTYKMWKLRSMILDADDQLEHHLTQNSDARVEWDSTQKLKDDPRITKIGRFLRRSSMDELPQLWNVLRGDMSLVGPRPMMPCQADLYPGTAYYGLP